MQATPASPATTPTPTLQLRQSSLVELISSLQQFAEPACKFLDGVLRDHASKATTPEADAVRAAAQQVPHFETLVGWVEKNREQAACVVLAAVYLSTGRYVVQELVEPAAQPAAPPASEPAPTPPGPQLVD
jgi:hypothetical protein